MVCIHTEMCSTSVTTPNLTTTCMEVGTDKRGNECQTGVLDSESRFFVFPLVVPTWDGQEMFAKQIHFQSNGTEKFFEKASYMRPATAYIHHDSIRR